MLETPMFWLLWHPISPWCRSVNALFFSASRFNGIVRPLKITSMFGGMAASYGSISFPLLDIVCAATEVLVPKILLKAGNQQPQSKLKTMFEHFGMPTAKLENIQKSTTSREGKQEKYCTQSYRSCAKEREVWARQDATCTTSKSYQNGSKRTFSLGEKWYPGRVFVIDATVIKMAHDSTY